jgi:hypothetical protein
MYLLFGTIVLVKGGPWCNYFSDEESRRSFVTPHHTYMQYKYDDDRRRRMSF